MTKIFIPAGLQFSQIKNIIDQIEKTGIKSDNIIIGADLNDFIAAAQPHDTIVVHSLDIFASLVDLLTKIAELQEREITLRSICEPWLNQEPLSTNDLLEKLRELALKIHTARTNKGLQKARESGKTLGRIKGQKGRLRITDEEVAKVEELRRERKLSLVAACREIGCSPNSYHTYYKRKCQ